MFRKIQAYNYCELDSPTHNRYNINKQQDCRSLTYETTQLC